MELFMKFLLGKKVRMGQMFADDGTLVPFTVVQAGPCRVLRHKTKETDGYAAIQVGYGEKKQRGARENTHVSRYQYIREFRTDNGASYAQPASFKEGDLFGVSVFDIGDRVDVTGISKGKGFQGVVKRHGFSGGKKTHGNKDQLRAPGSIGATDPQRVFKGRRMAGHMGAERVTVKNVEVVGMDKEKNEIQMKGAVPGRRGTFLIIKSA